MGSTSDTIPNSPRDEAVSYLVRMEDRPAEFHAYHVLWPAYGTYIGGYAPVPFGSAAGALFGHIAGRTKSVNSGAM